VKRKLSLNEKIMLIIIIAMTIIILLQWKSVWKRVKKGFEPYKTEIEK